MTRFSFNPVDPGIRTLWVFQFNEESKKAGRPAFDFYIPTPDGTEWLKADLKINEKALETLNLIQQTCEEIKAKCEDKKTLSSVDDYMKRTSEVIKNLEELDDLTKDFKEFLKELPPEDKQ